MHKHNTTNNKHKQLESVIKKFTIQTYEETLHNYTDINEDITYIIHKTSRNTTTNIIYLSQHRQYNLETGVMAEASEIKRDRISNNKEIQTAMKQK